MAVQTELNWKEVSKKSPCPLCGHKDWCYGTESLEIVICGRTHSTEAPTGYRYIKDAKDGRAMFGLEGNWETGRGGEGEKSQNMRPVTRSPRHPFTPSAVTQEVKLARLAEIPQNVPIPQNLPIPSWLQNKGVPETATTTTYRYSENQWINRYEWEQGGVKQKTIRQFHQKDGKVKCAKGKKPWSAYRIEEAVTAQGKWVLGVEGESCVETARLLRIITISWQGSNWSGEAIANTFTQLKEAGVSGLVYWPDKDEAGEKKADKVKKASNKVGFPVLILNPDDIWEEMPEKGDLADWVTSNQMTEEERMRKIEETIEKVLDQLSEGSEGEEEEEDSRYPAWGENAIASWLVERYRPSLAYSLENREWYRYQSEKAGVWSVEPLEAVQELVKAEVDGLAQRRQKKIIYKPSFINNIITFMKMELFVKKWDGEEKLIPMKNGVFDLENKELKDHAPCYRFTWSLPYDYNPLAKCDPIKNWFKEMMEGDEMLVELMRGYLHGILTGRTDWQKYLELIGCGGSGKSTFIRLAMSLVGVENTHTTTLKKLEESRFETASLKDKRLVVVTDSERFTSNFSVMKALTGQDPLPFEKKNVQSGEGFIPMAMVILAANEMIQTADYTSGLERRRVTVGMNKKVEAMCQRNLIEHTNKGEIKGEFAPYISGLFNWVMSMDSDDATALVKNHVLFSSKLAKMKAETLIETNPLAAWLNERVVVRPHQTERVGKRDENRLYGNYVSFCEEQGYKPVQSNRFSRLLFDLAQNQLNLEVEKKRDRMGAYFVGLKLREEFDEDELIITGCDDDSDDAVTMTVMMETQSEQACDDGDGQLENGEKIINMVCDDAQDYDSKQVDDEEMINGDDQENDDYASCVEESSSPSSQPVVATDSADGESSQASSQLSSQIKVGDEVGDILNGSTGLVVELLPNENRIVYECREFGCIVRHLDLVVKIE